MANTKIGQLPIYSGTAADLRWFVMNDSAETTTYKYSGYTSQLVPGTGTNSYRTLNATQSTGTNSIAIGFGASATGADSVVIGDITGNNAGTRTISIGKHGQVAGDYIIAIGSGAYNAGNGSIAIGHETSAYNGGIVLGGNTSRASSIGSITLGNANERGIGAYSSILGYGNKIGDAPNYDPGSYHNIIGSLCVINPTNSTYQYNNIFGGSGNIISGATSGATLVGMRNYTPTRSDATFAMAYVMTNYSLYNFIDDTAAAAGGVVLGQIYHTAGMLKIRIV